MMTTKRRFGAGLLGSGRGSVVRAAWPLATGLMLVACMDGSEDLTSGTGQGGALTSATGASTTGTGFGNQSGAGNGTGGSGCAAVSQEAMPMAQPADIIIAVDTSGSMNEEIVFVQDHMNDLSDIITASGIDAHVVMIADDNVCVPAPLGSGQCNGNDENLPIYRHVVEGVGSNNALEMFIETYPQWSAQLRPNAAKIFVVVTDDDSDMNAGEFTMQIVATDPTFQDFKLDGIFCFDDCPDAAQVGDVYKELVAQTMGVSGDLCLQDFGPVFMDIATNVVQTSGIACNFDIPPPPMGETFDLNKVNVQYTPGGGAASSLFNVPGGESSCDASGGWYYDDPTTPTEIILCPATCDAVRTDTAGKIDVLFGCDTVGIPS